MPPLFTATNWTSAVRKVLSSARHSLSTKALPSARRLSRIQRARIGLRRALHETYPTLASPGYTLNRINPVQSVGRSFSTVPGVQQLNPLAQAGRTVRMSGFRLGASSPRGASMVGQVGLRAQPSRAFSSTPHMSSAVANAPVVLRAFAHLLNDFDGDEKNSELRRHSYLPYSSKYDSYPSRRRHDPLRRARMQQRKNIRRGFSSSCTSSSVSAISTDLSSTSSGEWAYGHSIDRVDVGRRYSIRNIDHWFPIPLKRREQPIDLPPLPETLITPGSTTTLSIALSPSLQEILEPTTSLSYTQAEIGRSVFANLLTGILPLHDAFSVHSSTRVYPLLHKLTSLGLFDMVDPALRPRLEVIPDTDGRPDIMHIIFPERSVTDIRAILGETLMETEDGERWFALYESKPFTPMEDQAISEHWASSESAPDLSCSMTAASPAIDSTQLIFPQIEATAVFDATSGYTDAEFAEYSYESPYDWSPSEASSGMVTPPEPSLLTASLLSSLGSASMSSDEWSVPPSEADSDLESSLLSEVMGSENWSMGSEAELGLGDEGVALSSRPPSPSMEMRWRGEGFGLAQPW